MARSAAISFVNPSSCITLTTNFATLLPVHRGPRHFSIFDVRHRIARYIAVFQPLRRVGINFRSHIVLCGCARCRGVRLFLSRSPNHPQAFDYSNQQRPSNHMDVSCHEFPVFHLPDLRTTYVYPLACVPAKGGDSCHVNPADVRSSSTLALGILIGSDTFRTGWRQSQADFIEYNKCRCVDEFPTFT